VKKKNTEYHPMSPPADNATSGCIYYHYNVCIVGLFLAACAALPAAVATAAGKPTRAGAAAARAEAAAARTKTTTPWAEAAAGRVAPGALRPEAARAAAARAGGRGVLILPIRAARARSLCAARAVPIFFG
jgi:hypothetical protein